jgi:hypothetical protein
LAVSKAQVRDKAYKLNDVDGLYLLVTPPRGGRYWRFNVRAVLGGGLVGHALFALVSP